MQVHDSTTSDINSLLKNFSQLNINRMRANALGKKIWTTYINTCVSPGYRQKNPNVKADRIEHGVIVSRWMSLDEVRSDARRIVVESDDTNRDQDRVLR